MSKMILYRPELERVNEQNDTVSSRIGAGNEQNDPLSSRISAGK